MLLRRLLRILMLLLSSNERLVRILMLLLLSDGGLGVLKRGRRVPV